MKTKNLFLVLFLGVMSPFLSAQGGWQTINTVEEVCTAYPDQIASIFDALNLDYIGLEKVKKAYRAGNLPQACDELLAYYAGAKRVVPKEKLPAPSNRTLSNADVLLQDTYTFQGVTGTVPRLADGHLEWSCTGPREDREWAWFLNRHGVVSILSSAYFETGNLTYVKYIDQFIKSWIISSWPYPAKKSNTAVWRGLEVHAREKVWVGVFYNLLNTGEISPATRLLMLSSLPQHAHYSRSFHAAGNWLTMEISGLATVATAWPEFRESPEWMAYSIKTMIASMEEQVYPDGVQNELASMYHHVALSNFEQFANLCQDGGKSLPAYFTNTIESMWHYLAWTIRPDGFGVLNNDSDRANNRKPVLQVAQKYNRPEWTYIASNGQEGVKPADGPSCFFPWAGQLISRSGFDADAHWSFFDIGPWGTGHQHNDKLHLSIAAYGRDLLVDAGRFAYTGAIAAKFRKYALGSQGHNLVLVDGKGQANGPRVNTAPVNPYSYLISESFDYGSGSFDSYQDIEGAFSHTRAMVYVRGKFWVVADQLQTDRPRTIETLWHWHPSCKVSFHKDGSVATQNEYGNLKIIPVVAKGWTTTEVKGQETPEIQGWYSKEYNAYEPNIASIYSRKLNTDDIFVWILWPSEKEAPALKTRILSKQKDGVKVRITAPGIASWDVQVPFLDHKKVEVSLSGK